VFDGADEMRIAVISDIHGNLEALEATLADIDTRHIERVVCLGDIVGYGANPRECVQLVRERTSNVVLGNHDAAAIDLRDRENMTHNALEAIRWTADRLTREEIDFLRGLPLTLSMNNILFVHSAPKEPRAWEYIMYSFDARGYFRFFSENICFIGHSHTPRMFCEKAFKYAFDPNERWIINVGSVGQPRDEDNRSSYGVLDTVAGAYENIRVPYDIDKAAAKIMNAKLPKVLAKRLYEGK
jgi:diadenosine tetraphosphatase ApaH/serine/threonine PP2A family protein phosphatase